MCTVFFVRVFVLASEHYEVHNMNHDIKWVNTFTVNATKFRHFTFFMFIERSQCVSHIVNVRLCLIIFFFEFDANAVAERSN